MAYAQAWSQNECLLVRAHYANNRDVLVQLLKGRTLTAIYQQACKMGVTQPIPKIGWTMHETAHLDAEYAVSDFGTLCAQLNRHTPLAVRAMACKRKLTRRDLTVEQLRRLHIESAAVRALRDAAVHHGFGVADLVALSDVSRMELISWFLDAESPALNRLQQVLAVFDLKVNVG